MIILLDGIFSITIITFLVSETILLYNLPSNDEMDQKFSIPWFLD